MTKTALVTGANKGIGFGIAKALLQQGYRVLVGARDEQRGLAAVEALRAYGDAKLQLIDVSDLNSIQHAVADITKQETDFSLLVNNAGKIVNVSVPIEPNAWWHPLAYQAAKAPLNVMTKDFGLEFTQQELPVEIMAVMPGAVSTDLNNHIQGDFVKTSDEAGELIAGFATDGENHNGQVINFDGTVADYSAGSNV